MSKKYAIQFGLISLLAIYAVMNVTNEFWQKVLLLNIWMTFAFVSFSYWFNQPLNLNKRVNGKRSLFGWMIFWPYYLLAYFSLWLYRMTHRNDPAFAEVIPNLWFSRRMTASEIAASGVQWVSVLDLAAEFPRSSVVSINYHSLPMLDGGVPDQTQITQAIEWIDNHIAAGPLLVHCALGHGRTGCVVLSWLIIKNHVQSLDEGIEKLKSLRQGFGISPQQKAFLERYLQTISKS